MLKQNIANESTRAGGARVRLTQRFPFLLPVRIAQRKAFFYAGMRFDGHDYARTFHGEMFPHKLFTTKSGLYNANTGFDMVYQENKVFNLKLAAETLHGLFIRPGETFSFWHAVRRADRYTPYRDGLVVKNGELCVSNGGGLCQMSGLLFWIFLHSPLTIVERHGHRVQEFPAVRGGVPEGVDATVSEGWLDLRVMNNTDETFQIGITFDAENIIGTLHAERELPVRYEIESRDVLYFREGGIVRQEADVIRREVDAGTSEAVSESLLYRNRSVIGYALPDGTPVIDRG